MATKKYTCEKCGKTYKMKYWFDNHNKKCKVIKKKKTGVPGNKHNQKYDKQGVIDYFENALNVLKEKPEIVFIGQLAVELDTYRDIFSQLHKRFPKETRTLYDKIRNIIESRLYVGALQNDYNASIAKFGLKVNFKWKEDENNNEPIDGTIELE